MKQMRRAVAVLVLFGLFGPPAVVTAEPSDEARSYYHFTLAKMYEAERQFQDAFREYETALELDPDSSQLRFEFGRSLVQASEIRRGVEELETAIRLDPGNYQPHLLLGQVRRRYVESGEGEMLEKAIASFRAVLEIEENQPEALYYLGELLLLDGQAAEAATVLERFNRVRPEVYQGALMEARARLAGGNLDEAIEVLERARRYQPSSPDLLEFLGRLHEQKGNDAEALAAFQQALERAPTLELRFRTGVLLSRLGRHAESIELLSDVLEEAPEPLMVQLELAKAHSESRNFSKAADLFSEVLDAEPDNTEANYFMAVALRALGRRQEAIERVQHLLETSDGSGRDADYGRRLRSFLAVLYQDDRQYDKAVEIFRGLSEEEPGNFRWRLGLTYAWKDQGNLEAALGASREILEAHGDDLDVRVTHAQMLSESGRLEEAIGLLEEWIAQDPDEENYYLAGSQLYSDHKRYQDAEELLRRGLESRPGSERLAFQLAAMHERQGEIDRAEEGFQRILENNPDHAGVLNYLGYMLADRGVRLEEARGYIEKALEQDPHNGAYLDSLGWVYFHLGQLERAEDNLIQAARINDSDPTIFEHLGDLYLELEDYSKARSYYQLSLRFAEDPVEREKVEVKLASVDRLLAGGEGN